LQLKWCAAAALLLAVLFVASSWVNSPIVNVLPNLAFLAGVVQQALEPAHVSVWVNDSGTSS